MVDLTETVSNAHFRNCMSPSGKRYMRAQNKMGSGFEVYGSPTQHTKAKAECSMKIYWEMTVSRICPFLVSGEVAVLCTDNSTTSLLDGSSTRFVTPY